MFPLGSVLFPYALLPLHVFEPRYRMMMRHLLDGDGEFGVVLIERGSEVGGGDTRFATGTLARLVQARELPDGRFAVVAVGTQRLRVLEWLADDPYPQADVTVLAEAPVGEEARETRAVVERELARLHALWSRLDPRVSAAGVSLDADPTRASYEAAHGAPLGPLDAQRVLEADDTEHRLELLASLLADQAVLLEARLEGG
jgi:hypothetical protein